MSRDFLQLAAAGTDHMYMRRHSFNIFEMPKLNLCYDSNVNKNYLSGTLALVQKPSWSKREDRSDSATLSRVCSACFLSDMIWMTVIRLSCLRSDIVSG